MRVGDHISNRADMTREELLGQAEADEINIAALKEAIAELHKRAAGETAKRMWCAIVGMVAGMLIYWAAWGPL